MEDVESAREALAVLNGSKLQNTVIIVQPDARATPEHLGAQARGKQPAKREQQAANADPTRLFVSKLAAGVTWADLKRHFSHIGAVPYCDVYMYRQGSKEVKANPELEGMSKVCMCVCVLV
jgi:RNA recognition motif-containing protein